MTDSKEQKREEKRDMDFVSLLSEIMDAVKHITFYCMYVSNASVFVAECTGK